MKGRRYDIRSQARWAAMTLVVVLLLLLCVVMVTGCSDESDGPLPPYRQELCEVLTDGRGRAVTLRCDDGQTSTITNPVERLTPDSIYRAMAVLIQEDGGVRLHGLAAVPAPFPRKYDKALLRTDPVQVVTAWRVDRYINLRLAARRSNEAVHTLGFADMGMRVHPDGKRTKMLQLYHDSHQDNTWYTQESNVSCPLYNLDNELRKGVDSVSITVNTFSGKYTMTTQY